jgi:hypothetical protein
MMKLRGLVGRLLETPPPDYEHVQTVKIGERQHQMLRALAEFTGRSKTALAGELLAAAIEDALDSLPVEVIGGGAITSVTTGEPATIQAFVRARAGALYDQLLLEKGADEHLDGHSVREAA